MRLVQDSGALRLGEDEIEEETETDPRVERDPKQVSSVKAYS